MSSKLASYEQAIICYKILISLRFFLIQDVQVDTPCVNYSVPDLKHMAGKVAFITGASAGIGKACVEALATAGMFVAACARREDRLSSLAKTLLEEGRLEKKEHFLGIRCDVQQEQDIKDALAQVEVSNEKYFERIPLS
jgi:FlaA1/EpsC-like NDP-sugar epimerase